MSVPVWGAHLVRERPRLLGPQSPQIPCNADPDAKSLSLLSFSGFCAPSSEPQQPASWRLTPPCLASGIVSRPPLRPRPELRPLIGRRAPPGDLRPEKRALTAARAWRARTASPWTAATVASGRRKVSPETVPNWTRGVVVGGGSREVGTKQAEPIKSHLGFPPQHEKPDYPRVRGHQCGAETEARSGKERCLISKTAPPPPVQLLWKAL